MTHGRLDEARAIAEACLAGMGSRLVHVRSVGAKAERLVDKLGLRICVAEAAWLHDIGYSEGVLASGFHPLDGARWLSRRGWDPSVIGLVAHHSGAAVEAEERGLAAELALMPAADTQELDVLNLCDLTTSPDGREVTVEARMTEILHRYPEEDAVHRAVLRSRAGMQASVLRVQARLRSADVRSGVDG
ncbi:HD domain-containing protein [Jannaschia sp. R86511]|uniref:HD domain-containing protein n=1 Tax=Jannaschia sp. R86511 TaxID=3093853 RepID=UPI0036D30665